MGVDEYLWRFETCDWREKRKKYLGWEKQKIYDFEFSQAVPCRPSNKRRLDAR
jgi:hypothetical protein